MNKWATRQFYLINDVPVLSMHLGHGSQVPKGSKGLVKLQERKKKQHGGGGFRWVSGEGESLIYGLSGVVWMSVCLLSPGSQNSGICLCSPWRRGTSWHLKGQQVICRQNTPVPSVTPVSFNLLLTMMLILILILPHQRWAAHLYQYNNNNNVL